LGGGMVVSGVDMQVQDSRAMPRALASPVWARPSARARPFLRISMGPQDRFFDRDAQMALIRAPFQITDAADRMGVRLAGPELVPTALDMPSESIVRGSVQVSGDGVATVLMADHQTTGGYPKIATILSCDTDAFTQMRAHDVVRFRHATSYDAVTAARMMHRAEQHYLAQIGRRESWVPNI
jgi:allophanate hydrolase subunit 2